MATFKDWLGRTKDFYNRHKLLISFSLLSFFFFLCCFSSFFVYPASLLLIIFTFFEKNYGGFYYLMFSLPFLFLLKIGNYGYFYPAIVVFYVIYCFVKIFIIQKSKINKTSLILFLLLEIYLALPFNPYTLMQFAKMGIFLVGFMLLEVLREKGRILSFSKLNYAYIIGFLISCLFGFLQPFSPIIQSFTTVYYYNGYQRFAGILYHPNRFSIFAIMSLCGSFYLIFNEKYKLFSLLLCLASFAFGLATLSKSFILLSVVLIFFVIIKLFILSPKKAGIACGVFIVFLAILYLLFSDVVISIFTRFFSSTSIGDIAEFNWSEFLTFRNDLWGAYLIKIFESPHSIMFGYGLGAKELPNMLCPHNVYISLMYHTGLIGFVIMLLLACHMFAQLYKSASYEKSIDWFAYIPLLLAVMIFFVEDLIF